MALRGRGMKRAPSAVRSLASCSKAPKRSPRGVDGDVEVEEDIRGQKKGGNRRSLDKIMLEESMAKKLFPSSTQQCEMHAAPAKGSCATCHWGKCTFTKDALNCFIKFGFGVQIFFQRAHVSPPTPF